MKKKLLAILLILIFLMQTCSVGAQELLETFEDGDWSNQPISTPLTPDSPLEVDGWNLSKGNTNVTSLRLEPDPYHEGGKSILVNRPASWDGGSISANKIFSPISEDVAVGLRITTPKTFSGVGHYFSVYSSDSKRLVDLGFDMAKNNFTGKDWIGRDFSIGQWSNSLGLYFGTGNLPNGADIAALSKNSEGWLSYAQLEYVNSRYYIWEERYLKFVFHFTTKQIDVYFDAEPITDHEPKMTVPFVDLTASDISRISFGGVSGSVRGLYYDDISVKNTGETPVETVDYSISDASYTAVENNVTVKANVLKGSIGNGTVFAAAYNNAGLLVGVSNHKLVTNDMLYEDTFAVSDEVAKVKVFIFDNYLSITPLCASLEATHEVIISSPSPSPTATPGPNNLNESFENGEWVNYDVGVALNEPMQISGTTYTRGADKVINGWTLQGQDYVGGKFQLMNDPAGSGKGFLVNLSDNPNYRASGITATKEFDPVSGVVTFNCRFVTDTTNTNTGRSHFLQLFDGTKPILTFGGGYSGSNYNTTDWNGNPLSLYQWSNYFGLYFATASPQTDVNTLALVDGKLPYILLGSRGVNQTRYVKMVLNFTTKKIDVYYDSNPITSSTAIKVTVPFSDTTVSSVNKLVLGGAYFARGPLYWDDFSMTSATE